MIVDTFKDTVILSQANDSYDELLSNLNKDLHKYNSYNIIVNLSSINNIGNSQLLELLPHATKQAENNQSFVIVTDSISYEDAPEELVVVPTIQEAKDIIEMDTIERDLGL